MIRPALFRKASQGHVSESITRHGTTHTHRRQSTATGSHRCAWQGLRSEKCRLRQPVSSTFTITCTDLPSFSYLVFMTFTRLSLNCVLIVFYLHYLLLYFSCCWRRKSPGINEVPWYLIVFLSVKPSGGAGGGKGHRGKSRSPMLRYTLDTMSSKEGREAVSGRGLEHLAEKQSRSGAGLAALLLLPGRELLKKQAGW